LIEDVVAEIEQAPILQQKQVGRSFLGLTVTCQGEIRSITPLPSGLLQVGLVVKHEDVFFAVNPADYPGLQRIRPGTPATVRGRFADYGIGVSLEAVTLTF
jgi:hypothetical protein